MNWYKMKKQAGSPLVGIYWDYKGEIISFTVPVDIAPHNETGFIDSPKDHAYAWKDVQAMYPELRRKEYESVPRGRVVAFPGGQKFRIFIPPERVGDKSLVSRIIREFDLPRSKTVIETDEHYLTDTMDMSSIFQDDPFDDDYDPDISDML